MKLVLYGGEAEEENAHLDLASLALTQKKDPLITYIPSCSYESEVEFKDFVHDFSQYGPFRFLHFPVDVPFDPILLEEVLKSDLIHLGGGNTYYFLKTLRQSGLVSQLKSFVRRGGVLSGLSAGAIIMTPTISLAGIPYFDRDENEENLTNFSAMKLVNFEFFPHYKNSLRYDKELANYSRKCPYPIYACPDGCGIIINGKSIEIYGICFCFFEGKKFQVNKRLKTAC